MSKPYYEIRVSEKPSGFLEGFYSKSKADEILKFYSDGAFPNAYLKEVTK